MFHQLFFRKYCKKDCNREGEPNRTPFKLWEKSHGKIKSNFVLEKEEDYMASLSQHSALIDILKHLLLPSYACLTDD